MPTTKLGHSGIKIVTVYPDGVELIKVEHTFLRTPKNLSARKFFAELFSKNEWGLGQRPMKRRFLFAKLFLLRLLCQKKKRCWVRS